MRGGVGGGWLNGYVTLVDQPRQEGCKFPVVHYFRIMSLFTAMKEGVYLNTQLRPWMSSMNERPFSGEISITNLFTYFGLFIYHHASLCNLKEAN